MTATGFMDASRYGGERRLGQMTGKDFTNEVYAGPTPGDEHGGGGSPKTAGRGWKRPILNSPSGGFMGVHMDSSSSASSLHSAVEPSIAAVFSYLDRILREDQKREARLATRDDTCRYYGSIRASISSMLVRTFRLQARECPLRDALRPFRLYFREDMADALALGYCLHLQGLDPLEALRDECYSEWDHGLLAWTDTEALNKSGLMESDHLPSERLHYFMEKGDRVVAYATFSSRGYIVERQGRMVWKVETLHMNLCGVSAREFADRRVFSELGGTRGFLAGDFNWPPADGTIQITPEDRARAEQSFQASLPTALRKGTSDD